MWWGFPPDTRVDLSKLAQDLRTRGPLTPNQIERLLERWSEVEDESVAEFLELVEDDLLAVLGPDGVLASSADAGPKVIHRWVHRARSKEQAPSNETTLASAAREFGQMLSES